MSGRVREPRRFFLNLVLDPMLLLVCVVWREGNKLLWDAAEADKGEIRRCLVNVCQSTKGNLFGIAVFIDDD